MPQMGKFVATMAAHAPAANLTDAAARAPSNCTDDQTRRARFLLRDLRPAVLTDCQRAKVFGPSNT